MSNFCPEWIFGTSAALCAKSFLSTEYTIDSAARKFAKGLSENYTEIKYEELSQSAEGMLQFLSEIEAGEDAVEYLEHYIHKRINFLNNGTARKLSGLFASPLNPEKIKEYDIEDTLKRFRVVVFGIRNNSTPKAPPGWSIADADEGLGWFKELAEKPIDLLDNF